MFWLAGTASALDSAQIPAGRDVGAAVAYSREVDGQTLTFEWNGEAIRDIETGSIWNLLGMATDGTLKGRQLTQLPAINHFWFSWAAFRPDTRIYQP